MAPIKREKNCGNCNNCITGAARRFRCIALPNSPSNWWDGFPEEHACVTQWTEKKVEKPPIKVTKEK